MIPALQSNELVGIIANDVNNNNNDNGIYIAFIHRCSKRCS